MGKVITQVAEKEKGTKRAKMDIEVITHPSI